MPPGGGRQRPEGVTRPPIGQEWRSPTEQQDAILAAATEFSPARSSLYKAEVPGFGRLQPEELTSRARQITQVLSSPWVALSSGVKPDDFPAAVEAACRGGADGFLAGRPIWADSVGVDDVAGHLKKNATSRVQVLQAVKQGGRSESEGIAKGELDGRSSVRRPVRGMGSSGGWLDRPYLTCRPLPEGGVSLLIEKRYRLRLDEEEAERVLPFIANAIAVALGYSGHPHRDWDEPRAGHQMHKISPLLLGGVGTSETAPGPIEQSQS